MLLLFYQGSYAAPFADVPRNSAGFIRRIPRETARWQPEEPCEETDEPCPVARVSPYAARSNELQAALGHALARQDAAQARVAIAKRKIERAAIQAEIADARADVARFSAALAEERARQMREADLAFVAMILMDV